MLHTFFIRPILPIGVCSTSTKEIREQRETIGGTAHTCILFPVLGFLEMLRPFTSRSRTESANFRRFTSATASRRARCRKRSNLPNGVRTNPQPLLNQPSFAIYRGSKRLHYKPNKTAKNRLSVTQKWGANLASLGRGLLVPSPFRPVTL